MPCPTAHTGIFPPRPNYLRQLFVESGRPYAASVAEVDPDDDTIARWVVAHYRYDAERRERRHVVVAAFDNPDEFHADIDARAEQLRARRESGEDVDRLERITGRIYAAGYRRQQRDGHLLRRAIEHGVAPVLDDLDLPQNVSAVRAVRRSSDQG
ncbi:MAG: hypothetical protein QOK12_2573 [Mycobacterium sp.]|nr:hypothetical protein [Mycobacterium sp.]